MPADPTYFDTSYLVRLYLRDDGFEKVRELADSATEIVSAWHAQAEVISAFHRAFREGRLDSAPYLALVAQFISDSQDGIYQWLPLTDSVQKRIEGFFRKASNQTFLRAADALHLACAVEHGCKEVHSHDHHFLNAAPLFGIKGINVIPPQNT